MGMHRVRARILGHAVIAAKGGGTVSEPAKSDMVLGLRYRFSGHRLSGGAAVGRGAVDKGQASRENSAAVRAVE